MKVKSARQGSESLWISRSVNKWTMLPKRRHCPSELTGLIVYFLCFFQTENMLSKTERLAESVIKSVLEILRSHPETDFTELQIEQGTREKIISKQAILNRLRNNPKIHYDTVTGRYRFKPTYPIRNIDDLLSFIQSRPSLVVDGDLLECYRTINDDITHLLVERRVRAIRQSDLDRTIKCEKLDQNSVLFTPDALGNPKTSKCSLYSQERCAACGTNRGVVMMRRFDPEIESMKIDGELKNFWLAVKLPHISEIHRITQAPSQHLLTMNTSQILSNKATRKVRGSAKRGPQPRPNFSWSEVNANRVSNVHMLGIIENQQ